MKNKNIKFVGLVVMFILFTIPVFGLDTKEENEMFNIHDGYSVNWDHTLNTRDKQEFILTVRSDWDRTANPSLILSEYTRSYYNLDTDNFKIYYVQESAGYEYYTQWCTDYTYSDCQELNNGSYNINGGNAQKEVINSIETLMPVHTSQIKEVNEYFEFDLNDMVLKSGETKKYRVVFEPNTPLTKGDYGIFSVKVDGVEFWDKTHSSDFFILDNTAWWTLQTSLAEGVVDQSGNSGDATNNGATYDAVDDVFEFDGSTGYVDTNINTPPVFSVSFHAAPDSANSFIGDNNNANNQERGFYLFWSTSQSKYYLGIGSGGSNQYMTSEVLPSPLGQGFKNYVLTSSGTGSGSTYQLYVDGTKVIDATSTVTRTINHNTLEIGRQGDSFGPRYYDGKIGGVSVYDKVLSQAEVDEIVLEGITFNPYDVEPSIQYTGLQAFHDDVIIDTTISSNVYQDIYSTTANFSGPTNLTITYPLNLVKNSGGQANDVYMRVLIGGVPSNEFQLASLLEIGDSRSSFYNANILSVQGEVDVDVQIRREGNGVVGISSQSLSLFTGLTETGLLPNGLTTYNAQSFVAQPTTFTTAYTQSLPNASNNNTFVWFIGTIENTVSANPNDVYLRIVNGSGVVVGDLRRDLANGDDLGSLFISGFDYSDADTFSLEYKSDEEVTISGFFYTIDFVDNNGFYVGTRQNNDINAQITDYFPVDGQVITASSMSFLPSVDSTIEYTDYLLDTNTSTLYQSDTISRDYTSDETGVIGEFHTFDNVETNKNYSVYSDYDVLVGAGSVVYYNQLLIDSFPLDTTINTDGDINLTINEVNGSTVGGITGSCDSENLVKSITINDSDWVFAGDTEAFIFTYTGPDVETLAVTVTCTDIYDNSESLLRNYVIDTTPPTCIGIGDETFSIVDGETTYQYDFNIQCSDSIGLTNFSVDCNNGYIDNVGVSGTTYTYSESILLSNTTTCSYTIIDSSNLIGQYSNTFTLAEDGAVTPPSGVFDVNGKLEPFTCPTNYMQFGFLIVFLVLSIMIYFYGMRQKDSMKPIYMFIGALIMFVLPFYLIDCDLVLSMLLWVMSIAMLLNTIKAPFVIGGDD